MFHRMLGRLPVPGAFRSCDPYTIRQAQRTAAVRPAAHQDARSVQHDDVLVAWSLFGALSSMPMMMMRTLTDQLRRDVFEEMMKRRRDADGYVIRAGVTGAAVER
jgi:hypothetical protein